MSYIPKKLPQRLAVNGIQIELITTGNGRPLLFLHGSEGVDSEAPFLSELARSFSVVAPSHPGFGHSELPSHFSTIDDLAYFYLDLLEALNLSDVLLVGVSLGGWIAAEMAIKTPSRISALVLADPMGVKLSSREERDIVDIFSLPASKVRELTYSDTKHAALADPPDEALAYLLARNMEAAALYGWLPYMHNPKLKHRLHRISVPTLVVWGENDRIIRPDFGREYCALIPSGQFELIDRVGHYPHIERPGEFASRILRFVGTAADRKGVQ